MRSSVCDGEDLQKISGDQWIAAMTDRIRIGPKERSFHKDGKNKWK